MRRTQQARQYHVALKSQHMPRFHPENKTRGYLWIMLKKKVIAVGKCTSKRLYLCRERREIALRTSDNIKKRNIEITPDSRITNYFGVTPKRLNVGVLKLPEVVFTLRPGGAKHNGSIGFSANVRHTPLITVDNDLFC